jgi:mannose-6-phosphate isomerase-like protein (cupin superfamily)
LERNTDITIESIRSWLKQEGHAEPSDEAVKQAEQALLLIAQANAIEPPLSLRSRILEKIERLKEQTKTFASIDIEHPPLIHPDSNWLDWQAATQHIQAPEDIDNIHMHPLRSDDTADMFVVFVQEFVPEEVHHDVLESFLLLEGACVCTVTDETGHTRREYYSQGDYISFKHGEVHDVQILSTVHPAKAILQWLKKAA